MVSAQHVSQAEGVTVPVSQGTELCVPEPQVRLEVIDCDAVVTVSSSLLAEAEPVTQEETMQTMQPAQLERPKVMDRASVFLKQQFRLTPAKRGLSIQSPRRTGPSPAVPEPQP